MLVIINHCVLTVLERDKSMSELFIRKIAVKEFKVVFNGFGSSFAEIAESIQKCVVPILTAVSFVTRE